MPSVDERSSYLALALDARKTINALRQMEHSGVGTAEVSADLKGAIEGTVDSLKALASGDSLFAHLERPSSYDSYEQISTLHEVQTAMKEGGLEDQLAAVVSSVDPRVREKSLGLAIRFFSALENRALQRYNGAASAYGR